MSFTSLHFFCLFIISIGIYYVLPGKYQWYALLGFSIYFFCASGMWYTGIYFMASVFVTTYCAKKISKLNRADNKKSAKKYLILGIAVDLGLLTVLKYSNFFIDNVNTVSKLLSGNDVLNELNLLAPIGISYYTLQIVGYLLDVFWDITEVQPDYLKMALFAGYYPQLTSGPIARYNQMKDQLYAGHRFDWKHVTFGLQRILWGIFKKLVISERLAVLVNTIYGNTYTYSGLYIWFAAVMFMMQLYTDFSGCMDIIIGASECYGITLPENFKTPFFSRNVQEYWQRWHITLGNWLKDYILYPVLKSDAWKKISKWIKKHWGKKAARQIPSYLGMLCVWLLIGLWHGGAWKYILGMGLWFWACIVSGQVFGPSFKKLTAFLHINTDCFSWHLFQSLRVLFLVCIGNMFFKLSSIREVLHTLKLGVSTFNFRIFFDGSLYELGLDRKNFTLAMAALAILLVVSLLSQKRDVREMIAEQNIVFRWFIWLMLIFSIIIFGQYGSGYDAASFIYGAF